MNLTLASEEITALKEALVSAAKRSELLNSELVLVRTERDLLQEQLNKFKRDLFAAKSEASATHQKDLFFNEAEHLGATAQPGVEETADQADAIDVPAHKRKKRGRKPIDPALPRQVVRHELPEDERVCPHDGTALVEIGVETSEQLDIIPSRCKLSGTSASSTPALAATAQCAWRPSLRKSSPRVCSAKACWPG